MTRDFSKSGIYLRVLVSKQHYKPSHVALALDMDVWGCGESFFSALDDLSDNMKALISFALQFNCINMIEHAAPDEYLERYYARRYSRLSSEAVNEQIASMPYPDIDFDAYVKCLDHPTITTLNDIDSRLCLYEHRDVGQTKILYHPDINGQQAAYPVRLNADTTLLSPNQLSSMARRFAIPAEQLQRLFRDLS